MQRASKGRTSKRGSPLFVFVGCAAFALVVGPFESRADAATAEPWIERARALSLENHPQWLRLGHWREHGFGPTNRIRSQADGEAFFLSVDGARDPASELEYTIRAMFAAPAREASSPHARCRFPARWRFLRAALEIAPGAAPEVDCPRLEAFREELRADAVSLIFSSYYLNNPASAFGHTLLRIHKRRDGFAPPSDLLDTGIDFGANVDDDNALIYAFKGIVGMYPATFRKLTYAYKIRQYADYEARDLWAYRLRLSRPEVEMLVDHLWELGSTHFDYYYFTENCSYHILGAIAVARPEAGLLDRVRSPVIPADTVKTLAETPELVESIAYRPSLRSTFFARAAVLDAEAQRFVVRLADDVETPLPGVWSQARRVEVLDAAADLYDMRHARELIEEADSPLGRDKRALLARRADILAPSPDLVIPVPHDKAPHTGHSSRRVHIGPAFDDNGDAAIAMGLRLSLHDLADPSDGYPDLAQIEMGSVDFRVSPGSAPRFVLDDFSLIRIVSLNSFDRFVRLPSWRLHIGARTAQDRGCDHCELATVRLGAGIARAWWDERFAVFALADARVEAGHGLEGIEGEAIRAGVGPAAGLRFALNERARLVVDGSWLWHPDQPPRALWRADATLRIATTRKTGISFDVVAESGERRALAVVHYDF